MLTFDRKTLADHGISMEETEFGFVLKPCAPMPDDIYEALENVGNLCEFTPSEREDLWEFMQDKLMWKALKRATEDAPRHAPGKKKSKGVVI